MKYDEIGLIQKGNEGPTMTTYSGREICLLDLKPENIVIDDIAHALSMQCRYGGHCKKFYSVAEHSVYVSFVVPPEDAYEGLMHDCAEGYLQDLIRPLKVTKMGDMYKEYEHVVESFLAQHFQFRYPFPPSVKHADNVVLFTEKRDILAPRSRPWNGEGLYPPMERKIECWHPELAKKVFLERYYEIRNHARNRN